MESFILIAISSSLLTFTVDPDQGGDAVLNALKSSNASEVSRFFDDALDIKLPEKEEGRNIGKKQAAIMFKTFYDENAISNFTFSNQRESNGTKYIAGKISGRGKSYNITVMMRVSGSSASIISLRIN